MGLSSCEERKSGIAHAARAAIRRIIQPASSKTLEGTRSHPSSESAPSDLSHPVSKSIPSGQTASFDVIVTPRLMASFFECFFRNTLHLYGERIEHYPLDDQTGQIAPNGKQATPSALILLNMSAHDILSFAHTLWQGPSKESNENNKIVCDRLVLINLQSRNPDFPINIGPHSPKGAYGLNVDCHLLEMVDCPALSVVRTTSNPPTAIKPLEREVATDQNPKSSHFIFPLNPDRASQ